MGGTRWGVELGGGWNKVGGTRWVELTLPIGSHESALSDTCTLTEALIHLSLLWLHSQKSRPTYPFLR